MGFSKDVFYYILNGVGCSIVAIVYLNYSREIKKKNIAINELKHSIKILEECLDNINIKYNLKEHENNELLQSNISLVNEAKELSDKFDKYLNNAYEKL